MLPKLILSLGLVLFGSVQAFAEIPSWFGSPLGSRELPFGMPVQSLRCDWAGVFDQTEITDGFGGPILSGVGHNEMSLLNDGTRNRLMRAVSFFNGLASVNSAFGPSNDSVTPSDSIIFSTSQFIRRIVEAASLEKDNYESSVAYALRREQALAGVISSIDGTISFTVGATHTGGPNGLDSLINQDETHVLYDANLQVFYIGGFSPDGRLALDETRVSVRYNLDTYEEISRTEQQNGFFAMTQRSSWDSLMLSVEPERARSIHPQLSIVVTAVVPIGFLPKAGNLVELEPISVEIRNICTNETLALTPSGSQARP